MALLCKKVGVGCKLEINTMFDFHTRVVLKPMKTSEISSKHRGGTSVGPRVGAARRSSVAVMAGGSAAILTSSNKDQRQSHCVESLVLSHI